MAVKRSRGPTLPQVKSDGNPDPARNRIEAVRPVVGPPLPSTVVDQQARTAAGQTPTPSKTPTPAVTAAPATTSPRVIPKHFEEGTGIAQGAPAGQEDESKKLFQGLIDTGRITFAQVEKLRGITLTPTDNPVFLIREATGVTLTPEEAQSVFTWLSGSQAGFEQVAAAKNVQTALAAIGAGHVTAEEAAFAGQPLKTLEAEFGKTAPPSDVDAAAFNLVPGDPKASREAYKQIIKQRLGAGEEYPPPTNSTLLAVYNEAVAETGGPKAKEEVTGKGFTAALKTWSENLENWFAAPTATPPPEPPEPAGWDLVNGHLVWSSPNRIATAADEAAKEEFESSYREWTAAQPAIQIAVQTPQLVAGLQTRITSLTRARDEALAAGNGALAGSLQAQLDEIEGKLPRFERMRQLGPILRDLAGDPEFYEVAQASGYLDWVRGEMGDLGIKDVTLAPPTKASKEEVQRGLSNVDEVRKWGPEEWRKFIRKTGWKVVDVETLWAAISGAGASRGGATEVVTRGASN